MFSTLRLPNQLPDEKIIKTIRRDFFILFQRIVLFIFLVLLLAVAAYALEVYFPGWSYSPFYPVLILAASAYTLYVWLFFFFTFLEYYLDSWIITNERIISIEQEGFFARVVSEERLFRIQDVTSEVKGVLPTIFAYGDVFVQTAGERERFDFEQIPNPDQVRDMIIKLAEETMKHMHNNGTTEQ